VHAHYYKWNRALELLHGQARTALLPRTTTDLLCRTRRYAADLRRVPQRKTFLSECRYLREHAEARAESARQKTGPRGAPNPAATEGGMRWSLAVDGCSVPALSTLGVNEARENHQR